MQQKQQSDAVTADEESLKVKHEDDANLTMALQGARHEANRTFQHIDDAILCPVLVESDERARILECNNGARCKRHWHCTGKEIKYRWHWHRVSAARMPSDMFAAIHTRHFNALGAEDWRAAKSHIVRSETTAF